MSAFLIPENLPSRGDVPSALQNVARHLRDHLDEEITVWLEGEGDGDPYLVILDPQAGVLVLDAVGETGLRAAVARWPDRKVEHAHQLVKEKRTMYVNSIRERVNGDRLLSGRLPVGVAIAAPLIGRNQLSRYLYEDTNGVKRFLGRLSPSRQDAPTAIKGILTKEDFVGEALRPAIAGALGVTTSDAPPVNEAAARALLHPEIVIPPACEGQLALGVATQDGEDTIAVLDREQERLARRLDAGYRVIRGVAGSGKTLVLSYRARFLAEHFPQWKILFTCYNICLAKALQSHVCPGGKELQNIEVRHIDSVARRVLKDAGLSVGKLESEEDWFRMRDQARRCVQERRSLAQYDAVLVDEGQDFDATSLDLAYALLRSNREHFVIALDAAQNIYKKRSRWNPPGLTARGRTTLLKLNYRNTKEILEFAWRFLAADGKSMDPDELLDDPGLIVPPEATARRGPRPEIISCSSASDEPKVVADRILEAHKRGVPWGSMAIILGRAKLQGRFYYETKRRGIPYFWVPYSPMTKRKVADRTDSVRAFTVHATKGLEFSHVFFAGVNELWDHGTEVDPLALRRIAYVAMTRATERLVITVSGKGEIGESILAAHSRGPDDDALLHLTSRPSDASPPTSSTTWT